MTVTLWEALLMAAVLVGSIGAGVFVYVDLVRPALDRRAYRKRARS